MRARVPLAIPEESMAASHIEWIAGFLEGEGCFTMTGKPSPRIIVMGGDKDVLDRLAEWAGCGRVSGPMKTRSDSHTPMWCWNKSGPEAADLMRAIRPFMGARRQARIDEVLDLCSC
jgi:hypothetical protein